MIPIEKFELQKYEGVYEDRLVESELYFCKQSTGIKVSGYVIEKQYQLPDYYLLLINWDCPFEEGCNVVVLNNSMKVVGRHCFTPFYNSYLISDFSEVSKNHYELVFGETEYFDLEINYPKKRFFSKVLKVSKRV